MDKTKPFGLVLPKRAKAFTAKSNAVFGSDSDDEPARKKTFTKIPQAKPLSKNILKAELCEDPSIYEYDTIYDDMKAKEVAKIAPKEDKPSRYIDSLLKAADKRKKNYERRLEKKVQVEREKEGDKFKDKEAFVTSAYKKKMQEMEEEEERERRESQLNDMMDVTKQKDLSGFYRHFLKQSVGEEKIPVFGERIDIKKEPGTEPDSKQTGETLENSGKDIPQINPDLDRDSDIVSSSDEEVDGLKKVEPSLGKRLEKSPQNNGNNNKFEDLGNDESEFKVTKKKSHRQIRKKTVDDDSEDEAESSETKKTKSHRQIRKKTLDDDDSSQDEFESTEIKKTNSSKHKKKTDNNEDNNRSKKETQKKSRRKGRKDSDSDSHGTKSSQESDQEPDVGKPKDCAEKQGLSKEKDEIVELKKIEKRKNIFEKRTVGSVFADAQARYFQRLAARCG